jgi:hypothetical protein
MSATTSAADRSVRLAIEGRDTTEPLLTQIVSTIAGEPLSMLQVRETVAHLFSLGRFEGVSVDATLVNGRVALRYDLIPIHPVARIRFDGSVNAPAVDEGALRARLSTATASRRRSAAPPT